MSVNRDEWLKAVTDAGLPTTEDDAQAITTNEFMTMFGVGQTAARERLRKLVTLGLASQSWRRIADSSGRVQAIPAYRLVKEASGMKGQALDVDDGESLDGADVIDRAPEPDDEDLRTHGRTHPRARSRTLPEVPRRKCRPQGVRAAGRR